MGLLRATQSQSFTRRWAARVVVIFLSWAMIGGSVWLIFVLAVHR